MAVVLTLLFSPVLGMCYLGRGRWALTYLLFLIVAFFLLPVAAHLGLLPLAVDPATSLTTLLVNVVGAVHGYRIAARTGPFVPRAWFARWYFLSLLYIVPVVLALAVRAFLWEPFYAPAASMEPSLRVGDRFFVSKYAYHLGEPQRGDVVVFLSPRGDRTAYVKRLVGLPGDRIQIKAGTLYINGEKVRQDEVERHAPAEEGELYRETLPEGRGYLIRDLMEHSPMDDTDVFEVPPGHTFFLGDNRDNSIDSRVQGSIGVGYVPRENLIGPLVLIYWNSETQRFRLFDEE